MKALSIVAHSDDQLLWMGGTILRLNRWTWHILSLCKSHNNEDFEPKRHVFNQSCSELGADKYYAKDLTDYQQKESMKRKQLGNIKKEILLFVDNSDYDFIFTHSIKESCEYGFHANHVEVRDAVNHLVNENLMKAKGILYFCYKPGGYQKPVIADLDTANYKIELSLSEINKKMELKKLFGWAEGDLRTLSLWDNGEPGIEAFQTKNFGLQLPSDFIKIA